MYKLELTLSRVVQPLPTFSFIVEDNKVLMILKEAKQKEQKRQKHSVRTTVIK